MITWALIVSYWMGNATFQYAIPNIESETECYRVGNAIPKPPTNIQHYSQTCIEVKSAKPTNENIKPVCPKSAARVCS